MALPIYKVLSLIIRVFSKPMVTYVKQVHLKKDSTSSSPLIRSTFINAGNLYNRCETWVNRKFMKIQTQFAYKPLNDQLAIQKGIQFFYQFVFYSLIIGLPLYEMIRASNQAKAKSVALDEKLKKIDHQLEELLGKEKELDAKLGALDQNLAVNFSQSSSKQVSQTPSQTQPEVPNTIIITAPDNKAHTYRVCFADPSPTQSPQPNT